MSTRSSSAPYIVLGVGSSPAVSGDMSASITSNPTILNTLTMGTYAYSWSGGGTPVGNISVQISNDYSLFQNGAVNNAGTWTTIYVTLNGSSVVNAIPLSGNSGNGFVEWSTGAQAIRTVYTRTSGSGTLLVTIKSKVT